MVNTICLASSSQSRRTVLERAKIRFDIISPEIKEKYEGETPSNYVVKLAEQKANAVLDRTEADIIVAADSVVVLDEVIIEKPNDDTDALQILKKLQENTHLFYTGLCVINTYNEQSKTVLEITKVTFSTLTDQIIKDYVSRFQPFSFAGGYDNSISSWFIDSINGSQSNLMGLPMTTLRSIVEDFGHYWFDFIKT